MVTRVVLLVVVALAMTPAWGGPDGQEDICTSPAVIFCDNFEARSPGFTDLVRPVYKNPGWSLSAFSPSMAVTGEPAGVYEGRRALEFRYPAGGGGIGFMTTGFAPPQRTLYFRWYQKWSSTFVFSPIATKGASILTAASGQSLYIWWNNWNDGVISQWANPVATELNANMNGHFLPTRDQWHCLEIRLTMNSGAAADGYVQGWVDGVQHWEYPDVLLDPVQPNDLTGWILSGYWNCLTPNCTGPEDQHPLMSRWHDNIVISRERIGCLAQPPLAVAAVTPPSGSTAGGTPVDITGSDFAAGSLVEIGGASAPGVVNNPGWISAVTPPGAAGAADVMVRTPEGPAAALPGGFNYLVPGAVLLQDDFGDGVADGWTISPLGNAPGWRADGGVYAYDGGGHTQSFRGESFWSDYTVEARFRLTTLGNFPGGIRGRVNGQSGGAYSVWLMPAAGEIRLLRTTAWHIDTQGLTLLGIAGGIAFDTNNFHSLRMTFTDSVIEVYYDGALVIRATDGAYRSGPIALDVSNQAIEFDDVVVSALP
jgi:hypothetical protein